PLAHAYQLKEAFRAAMHVAKSGDVELFEICLSIFDTWYRASKLSAFVTPWPTPSARGEPRSSTTPALARPPTPSPNPSTTSSKPEAPSPQLPTWTGFRGQILLGFGEVIDPTPEKSSPFAPSPRGKGANYHQPNSRRPRFREPLLTFVDPSRP